MPDDPLPDDPPMRRCCSALHEASRFFIGALPIALVDAIKLIMPSMMVMQIGNSADNATPLAAASLGVLSFNVAGNMIITAPLIAMETIAPQAFGAGNVVGVGLAAQRAVVTALVLLLPTAPLWIWARDIFIFLGQPRDVADQAAFFMHALLPTLLPFLIFEVARKFLYAQGHFSPPLIAAVIGLLSHIAWLPIFKHAFGASSAPFALLCSFLTMTATLVALVCWRMWKQVAFAAAWPRGAHAQTLFTDRRAWRHFVVTSIASLVSLSEWLYWEFVCFRVGALGTGALASYSVGYSLEPCLFMLPLGLSTGLANSIGNHLGAGRVDDARRLATVGLLVGAATVTSYVLAAHFTGSQLARLFSSDPAVLAGAAQMWPSFNLFLVVSGGFALLLGLNRGLGLQRHTAVCVAVIMWPLGCPLVLSAHTASEVWQRLGIMYVILTTALSSCAGCSSWKELSERAIAMSTTSSTAAAEGAAGGGAEVCGKQACGGRVAGLAAADAHAADVELQLESPTATPPVHPGPTVA